MRNSVLRQIGVFPISKILIPVDWISTTAIADFTNETQVVAAINGTAIAANERFLHTPGNVVESGVYRWTGTEAVRVADFPVQQTEEYYEVFVESTTDTWYTYNEGGVLIGTDTHQWTLKSGASAVPFILDLFLNGNLALSAGSNVIPFLASAVNRGTWNTADIANHHYRATSTFRETIDVSLNITPHVLQNNPAQHLWIERSTDGGVTWTQYRQCWEIDSDQYWRQAALVMNFTSGHYYRFVLSLISASSEDVLLSQGSGVIGGEFNETNIDSLSGSLPVLDVEYASHVITGQTGDFLDFNTVWTMSPIGTPASTLIVTAHNATTDPTLTTPLATSATITTGIGLGQSVTVPIANVEAMDAGVPINLIFKAEVT